MKISKIILQTFITLSLVFLPVLALGQATNTPPTAEKSCADFKKKFEVTINGKTESILQGQPFYCTASELIVTIINYLLLISGTVTILFIMIGGFWYLTSAGNDEQAEKGKKTLVNSVIGLVVILLAFTIVRIVNSTLSLGN